MLTLNNILIDPFDLYPADNPPMFDDLVFVVIGENDEQVSAPDALGDLWDLREYFGYDLIISDVILEEK